ncbi:flagellar assembly protein FliH [Bacillus sp. FJAT-44742]|uniref:flagellar assembly protein FliH n=1 Tax=Bacillus sp. FJAT-44742 TaxID=2014005 RepID=UPI000C242684|nr:flagellar assembly protein FliH [Bacillus sp. FJAT-44742]
MTLSFRVIKGKADFPHASHTALPRQILIKQLSTSQGGRKEEFRPAQSEYSPEDEIATAAKEKEKIISEALKEKERMIRQAHDEADRIQMAVSQEEESSKQRIQLAYEEAREKGFLEGYEAGKQEGKEEYVTAVDDAKHLIQQAKQEYTRYLEEAEPVILNIALAVADRILYQALEEEPERWTDIVKKAVLEVKEQEEVTIFVPPSRFDQIQQQTEEIKELLSYSQMLRIYPDSQLDSGGCVIETSYGRLDASLDSQLKELKEQLVEVLKEEAHESSRTH